MCGWLLYTSVILNFQDQYQGMSFLWKHYCDAVSHDEVLLERGVPAQLRGLDTAMKGGAT